MKIIMKMVISLEAKEVWFGFWLIFMVFFQGRSPRSDSIQCLNLPRIDSIQYRIQYCLPKIESYFPWQIQLKSIQNFEIGSFPFNKYSFSQETQVSIRATSSPPSSYQKSASLMLVMMDDDGDDDDQNRTKGNCQG